MYTNYFCDVNNQYNILPIAWYTISHFLLNTFSCSSLRILDWHSLIYFCIFVIFVKTLSKVKLMLEYQIMTGIWKLGSEKTWFLTVHIFSCHTCSELSQWPSEKTWFLTVHISSCHTCSALSKWQLYCFTANFCGIIFYIPSTIQMVEKLIFLSLRFAHLVSIPSSHLQPSIANHIINYIIIIKPTIIIILYNITIITASTAPSTYISILFI